MSRPVTRKHSNLTLYLHVMCTWRNPKINCPPNWREISFVHLSHLPEALQLFSLTTQMSNNGNARKRPAPTPQQAPPSKQQATTPAAASIEEEFVDEDVFLEETLMSEDEESLILRDIEQRQAVSSRLSKWTRPSLSSAYTSGSRSIGGSLTSNCNFQLLHC